MLVTIFDPTMAAAGRASTIEHCEVTSMADIVAPSLAGPCLGEDLAAVREGDPPRRHPRDRRRHRGGAARRCRARAARRARPRAADALRQERGAAAVGRARAGRDPAAGDGRVHGRARPGRRRRRLRRGEDARHGRPQRQGRRRPDRGSRCSSRSRCSPRSCSRRGFTAGLVNRLIDRRLTGLFGRRAVPRRDHVVVVGLGQVGLRLALLLRRCGIGVVAVDDREEGENVGLAREIGLPVVIGRGADLSLLRRLSLHRALRARGGHRRRPAEHLDRDGREGGRRRTCAWSCAPATAAWPTRRARCSGSASCATCTASPRR